ncbi:MAG: hypothetical protein KC468_06260 [Myxococcales bacterium]|nr:hypothetical protein [Myxococcales bacterium]
MVALLDELLLTPVQKLDSSDLARIVSDQLATVVMGTEIAQELFSMLETSLEQLDALGGEVIDSVVFWWQLIEAFSGLVLKRIQAGARDALGVDGDRAERIGLAARACIKRKRAFHVWQWKGPPHVYGPGEIPDIGKLIDKTKIMAKPFMSLEETMESYEDGNGYPHALWTKIKRVGRSCGVRSAEMLTREPWTATEELKLLVRKNQNAYAFLTGSQREELSTAVDSATDTVGPTSWPVPCYRWTGFLGCAWGCSAKLMPFEYSAASCITWPDTRFAYWKGRVTLRSASALAAYTALLKGGRSLVQMPAADFEMFRAAISERVRVAFGTAKHSEGWWREWSPWGWRAVRGPDASEYWAPIGDGGDFLGVVDSIYSACEARWQSQNDPLTKDIEEAIQGYLQRPDPPAVPDQVGGIWDPSKKPEPVDPTGPGTVSGARPHGDPEPRPAFKRKPQQGGQPAPSDPGQPEPEPEPDPEQPEPEEPPADQVGPEDVPPEDHGLDVDPHAPAGGTSEEVAASSEELQAKKVIAAAAVVVGGAALAGGMFLIGR